MFFSHLNSILITKPTNILSHGPLYTLVLICICIVILNITPLHKFSKLSNNKNPNFYILPLHHLRQYHLRHLKRKVMNFIVRQLGSLYTENAEMIGALAHNSAL